MYRDSSELGPGLSNAITTWSELWKERSMNIRAVIEYESVIRKSGFFSEVEAQKCSVPVSGQTEGQREVDFNTSIFLYNTVYPDPVLQQFGGTICHALNLVFTYAYTQLSDPRFTEEMLNEALKEINDEKQKLRLDFYFIWARKHL